jgi:tRNA (guanine26-N2/guanine27-N2)-dimethyltransferase
VIANDLSSSAIAAMKRNVDINGIGATPSPESNAESAKTSQPKTNLGKVRINEGDAW